MKSLSTCIRIYNGGGEKSQWHLCALLFIHSSLTSGIHPQLLPGNKVPMWVPPTGPNVGSICQRDFYKRHYCSWHCYPCPHSWNCVVPWMPRHCCLVGLLLSSYSFGLPCPCPAPKMLTFLSPWILSTTLIVLTTKYMLRLHTSSLDRSELKLFGTSPKQLHYPKWKSSAPLSQVCPLILLVPNSGNQ